MIVFGTVSAFPEKLATQCAPGIARSMSGDWYEHWIAPSNGREIFTLYQNMMIRAGNDDSCEALVLAHDDLEFRDQKLATKIRDIVSDENVAVAGLIGSRGATSLAWWDGVRVGRVTDDAYGLHHFPDPLYASHVQKFDRSRVQTLDGMCLILSPWACQNLQIDGNGYEGFHGYADELCRQARRERKSAVVVDITAHHHSKGGYAGGIESWNAANENFRKRWFT